MLATEGREICQHSKGIHKGIDNGQQPDLIGLPGGPRTLPALDWGLKLA
jgi:hypothetical protein